MVGATRTVEEIRAEALHQAARRDDTLQKRRNVPLTEDTTDEEEGRENLSAASLDTIVERAMSPEPATQLAAVQVTNY